MYPYTSIVVPVYNSAESLPNLAHRIGETFHWLKSEYQLVMVDDCSTDNSWQVLRQLKKENPDRLKIIRLKKNAGQHNATLCGIHHSTGKLIVTIDDDLQTPPEEIPKLIHEYEQTEADLVYGIYPQKKHGLVRNIGSKLFMVLFKHFGSTNGKGSSFRLITRDLADHLTLLNQKYLLLDEVLCWYTNSISYVQVEHRERQQGRSNYSTIKLIGLALNYIVNYTIIPLRLMTYMGLIFSIFSFAMSLYYVYDKLFNAVELGFTSLIVAIFFSTSIILFCLGIIGEYISRLYSKGGSPHYIVKEVR
ncbi:MAG: glycosyltransferase family 2 protein [Chitinophagales bacterium]|nr:glycosyltransferase family 2 protein [Chitinophagales bacterium]